MSVAFNNSYFNLLPNEIIIKILGYVDTFAVLTFCELYECEFFFQDKGVIRSIDLSKKYLLEDLSLLSKKITFEYVNTLNINCLYWIPLATLRKFISKLVNLEVLYAIRTNLSITSADIEIYNKTKIEKLGVTVRQKDVIGFGKAPNIKTLYLNFVRGMCLISPPKLKMSFPHVTSLWMELEEPGNGYQISNGLYDPVRNKIFCRVNSPIPALSFNFAGLERYYNNKRASQCYVMCAEKFDAREPNLDLNVEVNEHVREAWKILDELGCPVPYGPKDAKRLCLDEATLDDISFEELNFHHIVMCIERWRMSQIQILKSVNAKTIKQLSISNCILNDEGRRESISQSQTNGFKRKRIGVVQNVESHSAEEIFGNFPDLEHLEIFYCKQSFHPTSIQAYPLIANFAKLQTLLVEVPVFLDGSFLMNVLTTCKNLESLKINSLVPHENLNHNLCNALPHASSLKDFSYSNHRIPLDKLIEQLCLIKSKKLERLVLMCNQIDKFSSTPLKEFLENNPQLTFLYFLIREATDNSLKMAQRLLNIYKKTRPSKIFFAKKKEIGEIGFPTPDVHYYEMMKFESTVATLRPLEHFLYF